MALFLSQVMNGIGQGVDLRVARARARAHLPDDRHPQLRAGRDGARSPPTSCGGSPTRGLPVWLVDPPRRSCCRSSVVRSSSASSMRPVERSSPLVIVIVTIGLFLAFNSLAQVIFGAEARSRAARLPEPQLGPRRRRSSAPTRSCSSACSRSSACCSGCCSRRRRSGSRSVRSSSNPDSSRLVGVSVGTMLMLGWGLAAALGARRRRRS